MKIEISNIQKVISHVDYETPIEGNTTDKATMELNILIGQLESAESRIREFESMIREGDLNYSHQA